MTKQLELKLEYFKASEEQLNECLVSFTKIVRETYLNNQAVLCVEVGIEFYFKDKNLFVTFVGVRKTVLKLF